jgi:hypothetical protein
MDSILEWEEEEGKNRSKSVLQFGTRTISFVPLIEVCVYVS